MYRVIQANFTDHTVYSKRNAHLIPIFFVPPWWRGAKIHMVNYVNGRTPIYIIDHVNFCPPPQGGHKKLELNVRFFWNRLYLLEA